MQEIRAPICTKIRAKTPCKQSERKSVQKSMQKVRAKQVRANGFLKVTLQIEKLPKFHNKVDRVVLLQVGFQKI